MRLAFFLALVVATFTASAENIVEINDAAHASHTEPSDSNTTARHLRRRQTPSDEERVAVPLAASIALLSSKPSGQSAVALQPAKIPKPVKVFVVLLALGLVTGAVVSSVKK